MKLGLVLTNDWELFGDGSGDYYQIQHNRTLDMLEVLDKYNAKMTFFAEVMQQLTFLNSGIEKYQKIANDWESILRSAYKSGHGVELHIHPQWMNSKYIDDRWVLDDKWSIGKLDKAHTKELILNGKKYLESTLGNNYKVRSYRAGAYYIQPSKDIISVLNEVGIDADSSVTKGLYQLDEYDYWDAESNIYSWNVSDENIMVKGENNLIEIPIYSIMHFNSEILKKILPKIGYKISYGKSPSQEEINWSKKRDKIKAELYPRNNRPYKKDKKNINWLINNTYRYKYTQLDYDYLPASIFYKLLKDILKNYNDNKEILPVIASGHIKDAHTNFNLEQICKYVQSDPDIELLTISEAIDIIKSI